MYAAGHNGERSIQMLGQLSAPQEQVSVSRSVAHIAPDHNTPHPHPHTTAPDHNTLFVFYFCTTRTQVWKFLFFFLYCRFGDGYIITVRVRGDLPSLDALMQFFAEKFPEATLKVSSLISLLLIEWSACKVGSTHIVLSVVKRRKADAEKKSRRNRNWNATSSQVASLKSAYSV